MSIVPATSFPALPARKDEAWRYADRAALASVWPIAEAEVWHVAEGENRVERIAIVHEDAPVLVRQLAITLAPGARCELAVILGGGRYRRLAIEVTMGEGAHFELRGAVIASGEGDGDGAQAPTLEIVSQINHDAPHGTSAQVIRTIAARRGVASYLGKVAVARGAQKTDASQSLRAILLDRSAAVNARPELEIYADDVKCAHGAAVGALDAEALFYLESRGLPPPLARKLVMGAFLAGAFTGLNDGDALGDQALALLEGSRL